MIAQRQWLERSCFLGAHQNSRCLRPAVIHTAFWRDAKYGVQYSDCHGLSEAEMALSKLDSEVITYPILSCSVSTKSSTLLSLFLGSNPHRHMKDREHHFALIAFALQQKGQAKEGGGTKGRHTLAEAGWRFMAALTMTRVCRISDSRRGTTPGRAAWGAHATPLGLTVNLQ